MDDENKEPSPGATPKPRHWKERYRWLGILMMAAFAGFGPAPPSPKPPQELAEYSQIADDSDEPNLDPEIYFSQEASGKNEASRSPKLTSTSALS